MAPTYDRSAAKIGVVHLGVGAFHRAHQAAVFDRALSAGDMRWSILGASLRSTAARDALMPQAGLYTLAERDGASERRRVIGALKDVLVAPDSPAALIEAMASPDVHIVTLTVTEKGYHLGRDGALSLDDAAIAADVDNLDRPATAIGFIVRALATRRERALPGFTVLSCDNIAGNGAKLGAAVQAFARTCDPTLADWIAANAAFPSTMVDRIVPATTADDIDALAAAIGVRDEAMVKTEPFLQWVIEDRFAGPRPDFQSLGVQIVPSVEPWETAKLRLLNGAHSAMAYLGGLAGLRFVHEFVADPARVNYIQRIWDEAETTLAPTPGLDLQAYRSALLARFANPALNHSLRQIAMDGSQKLPQRLIAPLLVRARQGLSSPALILAIAAWMKWQGGRTDAGAQFAVEDPLASQTRPIASTGAAGERVAGFLSIPAVFPPGLAGQSDLRLALTAALSGLDHYGAKAMMDTRPSWRGSR